MRRTFLLSLSVLLTTAAVWTAAAYSASSPLGGDGNENHTRTIMTTKEKQNTQSDAAVTINGKSATPAHGVRLVNGTLYADAEDVASLLGLEAPAAGKSADSIVLQGGDVSVTVTADREEADRDGYSVALGATAFEEDGRFWVPLRFAAESFGFLLQWDGDSRTASVIQESALLPSVGSAGDIAKLLASFYKRSANTAMVRASGAAVADSAAAPASAPQPKTAEKESDYSTTNVQTEGVDEGDIVKTDGTYLYQVNGNRVQIVRAVPAGDMKLTATVPFKQDTAYRPLELYLDDKTLTVVGQTLTVRPETGSSSAKNSRSMPTYGGHPVVKAIVYDIQDKSAPMPIREFELEGQYDTSRKIGSSLYLVSRDNIRYYGPGQVDPQPYPYYRDSAIKDGETQYVGENRYRYFPESMRPESVSIAGIDLDRPEQGADVSSYLGGVQSVYASENHLYLTTEASPATRPAEDKDRKTDGSTRPPEETPHILPIPSSGAAVGVIEAGNSYSAVYKFTLDHGSIRLAARGVVPGTPLNQFSMDEHDGYFRIATTRCSILRSDEHTSRNAIYVLDDSMNVIGSVDDLAPGEKIYSVRFLGNRAYMVTFKKVDPLFTIDLSSPWQPKVLGKLKIPGYSDYLHPYDETHLIGFGKDAVDATTEGAASGNGFAYYQGMKVALFDVSDVAHPVEMFKEVIGDRGTDSELLHDHRALLFSRDKELLAFPVTVLERQERPTPVLPENPAPAANSASGSSPGKATAGAAVSKTPGGISAYGSFTFHGAYVYHVDLEHGFQFKGKITHLTNEEILKAGNGWNDSTHNVQRIVYIGPVLYTLSRSEIRAADLETLAPIGRISLEP